MDFSTFHPSSTYGKAGDPLKKIITIDGKVPAILKGQKKEKKSAAEAREFDDVLLFKALVLQSLYNLFERPWSFVRSAFFFLGLHAANRYRRHDSLANREDLTKHGWHSVFSLTISSTSRDFELRKGSSLMPVLFER